MSRLIRINQANQSRLIVDISARKQPSDILGTRVLCNLAIAQRMTAAATPKLIFCLDKQQVATTPAPFAQDRMYSHNSLINHTS
jgi:hypothetical protein